MPREKGWQGAGQGSPPLSCVLQRSDKAALDAERTTAQSHITDLRVLQSAAENDRNRKLADMEAIREIQKNRYAKREWNYGFCEPGTLIRKKRIEGCGTLEAHITLKNDLITALQLRGDYFSTLPPEELAEKLIGLPLIPAALMQALEACSAEDYITGLEKSELVALLCGL